jgi:hypothetical protein
MDGTCIIIVRLIIGTVIIIAIILNSAAKREKAERLEEERLQAEEAKKQREFQAWYNRLSAEEKILYQLERQNKLLEEQGKRQVAIGGMIATHNMFDTMHRH